MAFGRHVPGVMQRPQRQKHQKNEHGPLHGYAERLPPPCRRDIPGHVRYEMCTGKHEDDGPEIGGPEISHVQNDECRIDQDDGPVGPPAPHVHDRERGKHDRGSDQKVYEVQVGCLRKEDGLVLHDGLHVGAELFRMNEELINELSRIAPSIGGYNEGGQACQEGQEQMLLCPRVESFRRAENGIGRLAGPDEAQKDHAEDEPAVGVDPQHHGHREEIEQWPSLFRLLLHREPSPGQDSHEQEREELGLYPQPACGHEESGQDDEGHQGDVSFPFPDACPGEGKDQEDYDYHEAEDMKCSEIPGLKDQIEDYLRYPRAVYG